MGYKTERIVLSIILCLSPLLAITAAFLMQWEMGMLFIMPFIASAVGLSLIDILRKRGS
ncbi:hypothetical protein LCGC14_3050150 [marine sediment metagenome]|uniref:Uncharacterized protein n=1 Tax=marine sediment metagenome TaxID=412755 RepID=A0A0F8ZCX9_9ZZZZ